MGNSGRLLAVVAPLLFVNPALRISYHSESRSAFQQSGTQKWCMMPYAGTKTTLAERVLLLFCHRAEQVQTMVHYQPSSEMDSLKSLFPDLLSRVHGKRVIDFGCGHGYQAIGLAKAGAYRVKGVEIEAGLARQAEERVAQSGLADRVEIASHIGDETADVIISQNSFEHFTEPTEILQQLKRSLAPAGAIYVTFGPLWYSPRGAHMGYFCRLPWVNLFFSENTIMAVRGRFRSDGKTTYKDAGLGKMSLRRFESLIRDSGLQFEWKRYDSVAGMPLVQKIPLLRELFVNRVTCVLSARAAASK